MNSKNTTLKIDWSPELNLWIFQAVRDGETWSWSITPKQYLGMIETMQAMQDQLNCALGAKLRNDINTGEQ